MKKVIRITSFIVILLICLGYINSVFKVKYGDGIYDVTKFYELDDNTVDVLILGSSHAFEDFNTGTLWDEYGLSSYILAGSAQPMWNTYYYLKEALKTQTPDLIILEGYGTSISREYSDDSRIIKNNFGLKWSTDKIESLKVSSPQEQWRDFFLEYIQYHTRYKELSRADFMKNQGKALYRDWKGFGCNMATTPLESIDISGIEERAELYGKTEKYYRATIELALEKGIPIVVIVSPYAGITENEQKKFNSASDIASEYGVSFFNCNLYNDEMGMDWSVDAGDEEHLNYRGNHKFTNYIGKYLTDNYTLVDHRGDPKYDSWERSAQYVRQMIYDQELVETTELSAVIDKIQNENYWVMISVDGTCNTAEPAFASLFDRYGIPKDGSAGIWLVSADTIWNASMDNGELYTRIKTHDFHLHRTTDEDGDWTNEIIIDNVSYKKAANGVNIVVFDKLTEKVADAIGFDADNGFVLVR